jgi:molybdopterin molybdotransferase
MASMSAFDIVVMVDWSARSTPSPQKPTKDAIFIAVAEGGAVEVSYCRTRAQAMADIGALCERALVAGKRVLAGFDFPFGYPEGFAEAVTGRADVFAFWAWLAARIEDADDNGNNRFDVAEALNRMFPGVGPFWGCPAGRTTADLPMRGTLRHGHGWPERRRVEQATASAQPVWKLFTTGSVGSQALLGIPHLHTLRARFGEAVAVRPFEQHAAPILLAEVYPSLLAAEVRARQRPGEILDAAQVRVLAEAFAGLPADQLEGMLREGDREEGWILGLGHEDALRASLGD